MLISAIISEVITEVGGDATDTTLIANMLIFAKSALRRFPLYARARLLKITSYATLAAGASYLTTPTYFIDEVQVWFEEDGKRQMIIKKDADRFSEVLDSAATGQPQYYYISGNVIQFDRKCDADRVIYVEHSGEVDDIAATSNFFGDSSMLEILKDGIKAGYYSDYVEDTAKGDRKFGLFQSGLDRMEEEHMKQEMGGHVGS